MDVADFETLKRNAGKIKGDYWTGVVIHDLIAEVERLHLVLDAKKGGKKT